MMASRLRITSLRFFNTWNQRTQTWRDTAIVQLTIDKVNVVSLFFRLEISQMNEVWTSSAKQRNFRTIKVSSSVWKISINTGKLNKLELWDVEDDGIRKSDVNLFSQLKIRA